jgi:hypothetical protein
MGCEFTRSAHVNHGAPGYVRAMLMPATAALRRGVLAVCVLHDVDLLPAPDGVVLTGATPVRVSWQECLQALDGADPEGDEGRHRLAAWLQARRCFASTGPAELSERIRPVGLPVGHVLHPGSGWSCRTVLGGAVELGLGVTGVDPARPGDIVVVAPGVWAAQGIDPMTFWPVADRYLAAMSHLAAERRLCSPTAPLRPMGDCDVITLLCDHQFRAALSSPSGGMITAGVPMRDRGWTELRRIDPAFLVAAAAATDPPRRGFPRPLLVTSEEVVMVAGGGQAARLVLLDDAPEQPWWRPVLYR